MHQTRLGGKKMSGLTLNRRQFIRNVTVTGAGLSLAVYLPGLSAAKPQTGNMVDGAFEANAFVSVGTDNTVTVRIKHLEMGQGAYTGLATLVAEEMDADWQQVVPVTAPADATKYNNLFWGPMQGTGGSSAIANSYMQLRQAGAAARAMLVAAAAKRWSVASKDISVSKGVISAGSNRATFGELARAAALQMVPDAETLKLKKPSDFVYIGKDLKRKDTGKSDGSAIFTQDIKLPGMLTAAVAHPPLFGATLAAVNDANARKIKGVVDVVKLPNAVAVLARDFWTAKKGRNALEIRWDEGKAFRKSTSEIMAEYQRLAEQGKGLSARKDGDADAAFKKAAEIVEARYTFPYLAHATMEPMNCVALVKDDSCELWYGSQTQTADQNAVAEALGLKAAQVNINTLMAGGSFGRRASKTVDYVLEAALIAKARKGTAVKLVWSREEDTRAGHYRPAYVHKLKGGLDEEGSIIAWEHRIVGQSILGGTPFEALMVKDGIDATSVEGAVNLPYAIPNLHVELITVEQAVPVQWWRSVGHTHTAYATETFLDQLAHAGGKDPLQVRMQLLKDHPRHAGVLKLAAEKAGWGKRLPAGRAMGLAVHESFSSFVAEVAEVSAQDDGRLKVEKVVCAVDCGVAVNPDIIKAQMESGIGYGLSAALGEEITLEAGRVVPSNFHDYRILRINQMPDIEVHIVPSAEPPTGVGEPGTPPAAPAAANALRAATGKLYEKLPIQV